MLRDFDLLQIRSSHTVRGTFYILKAWSWLSLLLTCGAALPLPHSSSFQQNGSLGNLPRTESVKTGCPRGVLSE